MTISSHRAPCGVRIVRAVLQMMVRPTGSDGVSAAEHYADSYFLCLTLGIFGVAPLHATGNRDRSTHTRLH